MQKPSTQTAHIAIYFGDRKTGKIVSVQLEDPKHARIQELPAAPASGLPPLERSVLAGLTPDRQCVFWAPTTRQISIASGLPADGFPAHVYRDPYSGHDWYMNDGDKDTGNDTLNCGQNGSSVTVIADSGSADARHLATVCVGRGHHQAAFTAPSPQAPHVPRRAFISNLKDGTLSVIGTDPNESETYLKNIATIDLREADKETNPQNAAVNNAFPHGLVYSPLTGKVYNLNNGYGTVAIIDPLTAAIERRIDFKGHSNLFIAHGGRYVIGRGADRKRDPQHVIAKLSVLDVTTLEIVDTMNLMDIYISKYYFNADESKLYLTTSVSGSPEQQLNLKKQSVVVLDMTALPKLKLSAELQLGEIGGLAFFPDRGVSKFVFASQANTGELIVMDAQTDFTLAKLKVHAPVEYTRIWTAG